MYNEHILLDALLVDSGGAEEITGKPNPVQLAWIGFEPEQPIQDWSELSDICN